MDNQLRVVLEERGVPTSVMRVGTDVVCRVGDPTTVIDLQRVAAHRCATHSAIVLSDVPYKPMHTGEVAAPRIYDLLQSIARPQPVIVSD